MSSDAVLVSCEQGRIRCYHVRNSAALRRKVSKQLGTQTHRFEFLHSPRKFRRRSRLRVNPVAGQTNARSDSKERSEE